MITGYKTKIQEVREILGVTQKELADAMGISQSVLSLIESGQATVSLEHLIKIASFLRVGIETLYELQTDKSVSAFDCSRALRKMRLKMNFTQEEIAKMLNLPNKSTYASWESGKSSPSVPKFFRVCEICKTKSLSTFLEEII